MLRKLNKFFKPKEKKEFIPTNRIEKRPETTKLLSFLDKLRNKEVQLKEAALKKGSDSLDYRKHSIVSTLLKKIDEKINAFNMETTAKNEHDEIKSIINLAQDLLNIIEKIMTDYSTTLQLPRNYNLKTAIHSVDVGACGVVYGTAAVIGLSTFGTGVALVAAAPELSHVGKKALGLLNTTSATSSLLLELQNSLKQMIQNLSLTLNLIKPDEKEIISYDEFKCPLTHLLMRDPVFCKLDGQTYEKKAIMKWLTEHRSSPKDQKEMKAQDSIEDVLQPNTDLKVEIEKYLKDNPELYDTESSRKIKTIKK